MIEIITGDLLEAKEKYIIHQTNCFSTGSAAGIARAIFDKYPYANCYSDRKEVSKPGSIDIRGDGIDKRYIINLHGQLYPGSPKYSMSIDNEKARKDYFYQGLLRVAKIKDLESIAFPYRIGCGIAGGNWKLYLKMINNFANYVETKSVKVVMYQREQDV